MGYSKKNLRDVEDMAGEHGLSETQQARFPRAFGARVEGDGEIVQDFWPE